MSLSLVPVNRPTESLEADVVKTTELNRFLLSPLTRLVMHYAREPFSRMPLSVPCAPSDQVLIDAEKQIVHIPPALSNITIAVGDDQCRISKNGMESVIARGAKRVELLSPERIFMQTVMAINIYDVDSGHILERQSCHDFACLSREHAITAQVIQGDQSDYIRLNCYRKSDLQFLNSLDSNLHAAEVRFLTANHDHLALLTLQRLGQRPTSCITIYQIGIQGAFTQLFRGEFNAGIGGLVSIGACVLSDYRLIIEDTWNNKLAVFDFDPLNVK